MHKLIGAALCFVALAGMVTFSAIVLPIVYAWRGKWADAAFSLLLIPLALAANWLLAKLKRKLSANPDDWRFHHLGRNTVLFLISFAYLLGAVLTSVTGQPYAPQLTFMMKDEGWQRLHSEYAKQFGKEHAQ